MKHQQWTPVSSR